MAKLITRTLTTTNIKALFANLETKEITTEVVVAPSTFKDNEKALKYLKANAVEGKVPVSIVSMDENKTLYGISEKDFLAHAQVIEKPAKNEQ